MAAKSYAEMSEQEAMEHVRKIINFIRENRPADAVITFSIHRRVHRGDYVDPERTCNTFAILCPAGTVVRDAAAVFDSVAQTIRDNQGSEWEGN